MWQLADIGCFQLAREMSKSCPEDCGDLSSLDKLAKLGSMYALFQTYRISVVAQQTTNPWPEPYTFPNHFKDVDGEEKH